MATPSAAQARYWSGKGVRSCSCSSAVTNVDARSSGTRIRSTAPRATKGFVLGPPVGRGDEPDTR